MALVTIKDVARISGVSRATVSAVLHGKSWVSEKTRQKVQTALREQNYQGHLVADTLSRSFAKMVGVVLGNIRNPFNTELISRLQDVLQAQGYFMVYHGTDESYEDEVEALKALEALELGGYVVAPVQEGRPHDHIRRLIEAGKPLVAMGEVPGLETHVVDFDDRRGSKDATDHLVEKGHRRIVCLSGPETSSFAKHRVMGFVESLMDHRIPFDESMVVPTGATFAKGYKAAKAVLTESSAPPTALLCFNDMVAVGAYKAAYDLGVKIPRDLSIVGFDDVQLAAVMGPPLTTVATHAGDVGAAVAEILLTVLQDTHRQGFLRRKTSPELIERESVRAL